VSSAAPSGDVTFLFTDIEGSTRRWERNPLGMRRALVTHDRIVQRAIVDRRGYVFKTFGDEFCAAFANAADAVEAAYEVTRALACEDFSEVGGLKVRAAIHAGTADERDGDYFGEVVNRVARLLAVGHGGQVLLSGTVADRVRDRLPAGAALRDLGGTGSRISRAPSTSSSSTVRTSHRRFRRCSR